MSQISRSSLELLKEILHESRLDVGKADFVDVAPRVVAAKNELEAALTVAVANDEAAGAAEAAEKARAPKAATIAPAEPVCPPVEG